jgi:hypothetical protein
MRLAIATFVLGLYMAMVFGEISSTNQAAEYRSRFLNVDLLWQASYWHFGIWTPNGTPLRFRAGVEWD